MLEQRDVRAKVEMGPVTLAAVDQEEIGMGGTAPWGSWTPGRVAPPTPAAGCSSGMGSATHSVTLKSVCLMAMTVRLLQPAPQPMTSSAMITSTMGTVKKAATLQNVAGTGETAGPKMGIPSGGPPWPCWWY